MTQIPSRLRGFITPNLGGGAWGCYYDSTNGTMSDGDVIRIDGWGLRGNHLDFSRRIYHIHK
jgi:hypothetical protein